MKVSNDDYVFCDLPGLIKIKDRLLNTDFRGRKLAFLIYSGSFNPIHTEHLHALKITKAFLEKNNYTVLAAFIVPSGNKYLNEKLGAEAYPLEKRIELCRLAIRQDDWMCVAIKDELSSKWACIQIGNELKQYCADALQSRELFGIEIMGSDSFYRIFSKVLKEGIHPADRINRTIICLSRPGDDRPSDIESTMIPGLTQLGVNVQVPGPDCFDGPLREISSTAIRNLISLEKWDELEKKQWLPEEVFNRMKYGGKS